MTEQNLGRASPTPCPAARTRNAAATKQAILEAARRCFAAEGYEQVGVREIAAQAGIDPALVNRYFGSKEGLFSAAVKAKFDMSGLFAGDRATLGERLVRAVLKKKAPGGDDPLVALLRSSSSDVAGCMLREAMVEGFVRPLTVILDGPHARERAELIGSTLLGLVVFRYVVGCSSSDDIEQQVSFIAPNVQRLIDGDCLPSVENCADGGSI